MLILILITMSLLTGCVQASAAQTRQEQLLKLSPMDGEMPTDAYTYPRFASEDLNGNYGGTLGYNNFTEVRITLEDATLPLEDAIRKGLVYGEDLHVMAQVDARNHYCVESNYTKNGKTTFYYRYDGYTLEIINDVYETPDGKAYLLRETTIYPSYGDVSERTQLTQPDPDRDPFDLIDKEDWGLTLTVSEATPTGMKIQCQQTGGQQFGELKAVDYYLYSYTEDKIFHAVKEVNQPLTMEGSTELTLDWEKEAEMGQLPEGDYLLRLYIQDVYKTEDVPPLSRNYRDQQMYQLDFTIS